MVLLRYKEAQRVKKYQPSAYAENILTTVNKRLARVEKQAISRLPVSNQPMIFICYAPRSGSTILSQMLARTGCFNYVSNFMARFWSAPYIGGLLERELKIKEDVKNISLESEFGVTKNCADPHEFGFFWHNWLPCQKTTTLNQQELKRVKKEGLKKEVNAMLSLYDKPTFFKNGIAGMNATLLSKIFPNSFFVIIKRRYSFIAQSIYQSRITYLGSANQWWSIKPAVYEQLAERDVYAQIAGQIIEIYQELESSLEHLSHRVVQVKYEDFCHNPIRTIDTINQMIGYKPGKLWHKNVVRRLRSFNSMRIDKNTFKKLKGALSNYPRKWGLEKKLYL